MTKKLHLFSILIISLICSFFSINSFAKVILTPSQVPSDTIQVFTLGVPVNKDSETVKVRLSLPEGVSEVVTNVKLGWNIEVKKEGDKATEIQWAGGVIPKNYRDDFVFTAKTSNKEQDLKWKVYQTFRDGTEIAWDKEIKNDDNADSTPYILTKITNNPTAEAKPATFSTNIQVSNIGSFVALGLSIIAIGLTLKNSKVSK